MNFVSDSHDLVWLALGIRPLYLHLGMGVSVGGGGVQI